MTVAIYQGIPPEKLDEFAQNNWIYVDQFLKLDFYQHLAATVKDLYQHQPTLFKKAGISRRQAHHLDQSIRDDDITWIDQSLWVHLDAQSEQCFKAFWAVIETLRQELNRTFFLGLKSFEIQLAHYHAGAKGYQAHLDAFKGQKNRVISAVYYLNDTWEEKDGGMLYLPDENQSILPIGNRFVIFKSEEVLHEVKATHRERWAFAIWFRQREDDLTSLSQ
jgi:SM-20-related protein